MGSQELDTTEQPSACIHPSPLLPFFFLEMSSEDLKAGGFVSAENAQKSQEGMGARREMRGLDSRRERGV